MLEKRPTSFMTRRKRAALRRGAIIGSGVLAFVVTSIMVSEVLAVRHVRVNAALIPLPMLEDWAAEETDRWELTEVSLLIDGRVFRRTRSELGAQLLQEELRSKVDRVIENGEDPDALEVTWQPEIEHAQLLRAVFELREQTAQTTESKSRGRTEHTTLDLHASLKTVREALEDSALFVKMPMRKVARIRDSSDRAYLLEFSERLSRHKSKYRVAGRSWGRGHNIEKAAKALDGVIIEPRSDVSFNEVVGERSFQRGFMPAPEIARGRVVDGVGGGVCQVATALHDAALHAAFDVLEHYVHSKRPRYAGRGYDSAVAWGLKDLRIQNPFTEPVLIKAYARVGTLELELWSGRGPLKVDIEQEIVEGTVRDRQNRLLIERTRVVHWPDGERTDVKMLKYPAEPRD